MPAGPLNGRANATTGGTTYPELDEDPPADWELEVGDVDDETPGAPSA